MSKETKYTDQYEEGVSDLMDCLFAVADENESRMLEQLIKRLELANKVNKIFKKQTSIK